MLIKLAYSGEYAGLATRGKAILLGAIGSFPAKRTSSVAGVSRPCARHSSLKRFLFETCAITSADGVGETMPSICALAALTAGMHGSELVISTTVLSRLRTAMRRT